MSYEIVKSLIINEGGVWLTSAANNVYPRTFEKYHSKYYTEMLNKAENFEEGVFNVLADIGKSYWNGSIRFNKGSKLCNCFIEAKKVIPKRWHSYMRIESSQAGKYFAKAVMLLDEKFNNRGVNLVHNGYNFPKLSKEVTTLLERAKNPDMVLEDSIASGYNFQRYSPYDEIRNNPKLAFDILNAIGGNATFEPSQCFINDYDYIKLVLKFDGCNYRYLKEDMKKKKELIDIAFDESIENRRFHEHLPDQIPFSLFFKDGVVRYYNDEQLNADFICHLIDICPSLHVWRISFVLENKEVALKFVKNAKNAIFDYNDIPAVFMVTDEFKNILIRRCMEYDKVLEENPNRFKHKTLPKLVEYYKTKLGIILDVEEV